MGQNQRSRAAATTGGRAEKGFYYVSLPEDRASRIDGPADNKTSLPPHDPDNVPNCIGDSGTWGMTLPVAGADFFAATGLVADSPFILPRYPSACADIPLDAGFDLVFKGQDGKSKATVRDQVIT